MGLVVTTLVVFVTVGLGGLEKSTSEDSLSDEVDSEDDDDGDASALMIAVEASVVLGASSADSLSDDEVSEDVFGSGLTIAFVATAGLERAGSLSDAEASEEDEELTGGLETEPLIRGCEMTGLVMSFFTGTAFAEEEVLESDSDSELEELLGLAFRFNPFTSSVTVGFFEAAGIDSAVPAFSSSSSASLSELEPDVESDALILDDFVILSVDVCAGVASFISTSESISSSLFSLPLLLVTSFATTLAAASSRALASAFTSFFAFFAFLDCLAALVLSLSSVSLLLVSSVRDCSW